VHRVCALLLCNLNGEASVGLQGHERRTHGAPWRDSFFIPLCPFLLVLSVFVQTLFTYQFVAFFWVSALIVLEGNVHHVSWRVVLAASKAFIYVFILLSINHGTKSLHKTASRHVVFRILCSCVRHSVVFFSEMK
jgi:hypothetical protein